MITERQARTPNFSVMQKLQNNVDQILAYFSHKVLNGTMLFSGVAGTTTRVFAENVNLVMYWLLFGVVVAVIRIAKYRQEARHKEERHRLEIMKIKQELNQDQETHQAKLNNGFKGPENTA